MTGIPKRSDCELPVRAEAVGQHDQRPLFTGVVARGQERGDLTAADEERGLVDRWRVGVCLFAAYLCVSASAMSACLP